MCQIALPRFFQEYGFGREHPFVDALSSDLLFPLLDSMNALQQVILIEGFDMELLQVKGVSALVVFLTLVTKPFGLLFWWWWWFYPTHS